MRRFLLRDGPFRLDRESKVRASRSAGCRRRTGGHVHQVDGGVVVATLDHATAIACPFPVRERQAGMDLAAVRTGLTRWIPRAGGDNPDALHRRLGGTLAGKLQHADIRNGLHKLAFALMPRTFSFSMQHEKL